MTEETPLLRSPINVCTICTPPTTRLPIFPTNSLPQPSTFLYAHPPTNSMASSPPSSATPDPFQPSQPLYNKTYTLHRLSPLHNLSSLSHPTLSQHAQRLLSILRGDILRGVRVSLASSDDGVVNAGRLESCEWQFLSAESLWGREQAGDSDGQGGDTRDKEAAGVWIELRYEKSSYTALLLRNAGARRREASSGGEEMRLPLLLMHMPSPLRATVRAYLTTTFDTRIEEMRLSDSLLTRALEGFLADLSPLGAVGVAKVVKEIQITLAFRGAVAPSLRTLDVAIRRGDVPEFLTRGGSIADASKTGADATPFMSALRRYLKAHLALDMAHEDVRVSKVACGGVVLASEGRIKIVAPVGGEGNEGQVGRRAVVGLMGRLFERAEVRGLEDELGG